MRAFLQTTALVLGLALGAGARAADAGADAARSYRLETEGSTRQVAAGGQGKLVVTIVPSKGTHVHPQAPLKITLAGSPGLKLAKDRLGHADALDPRAEGPRFEVPFTALATGAQEVKAKVEFFICSDQWCVKQARDLAVSIDVR
jgi:hypothetical protein